MSAPEHVKKFVNEHFPKGRFGRQKSPDANPYRTAYEEKLAEDADMIEERNEKRKERGRDIRGGF